MADGPSGRGPVAAFCAQLKELRRSSGRSPAGLAHDLRMSRGHLSAILNGEVKRPPDFSRVVEPLVRACGGDAAVADWRKRHDVLEQVYQEPHRRDETPPETDLPPAGPRSRTRRPRPMVVTVVVALVLVAFGAGAVAARVTQEPALPPVPAPALSVAESCPETAPIWTNLLDLRQPSGGRESWWATDERVTLTYDRLSFAADVPHAPAYWELFVLHSCNPIVVDRRYRLSFTASADVPVSIVVRVQDNRPPAYQASLDVRPPLTATPQRLVYDFTGAVTNPESEVAFLVGANPAFRLWVSDVELVTTAL